MHGTASAEAADVNVDSTIARAATILLVDDDVELLKALTKVLEKENYEVIPQPDADSAIAYLNTARKKFDLVLTDVSMPGMKGTAFLSVVKITAFGDWGQYMDAVRSGAFEYLSKPLEKSELLKVVRRALSNGTARNNHGAAVGAP